MTTSMDRSRRPRSWRRAIGAAAIAASASTVAVVPATGSSDGAGDVGLDVYGDALADGFQDWSWASTDLASSEQVSAGSTSVRADLAPWGGLSLGRPAPVPGTGLDALRFDVHGGTNGDVTLRVVIMDAAHRAGPVRQVVVPGGTWTTVTIPLAELGSPEMIGGVWWQEGAGRDVAAIHVDEVRFVTDAPATTTTTEPPPTTTTSAPPPTTTTTTAPPPTTTTTTAPPPTTTTPPPSGTWAYEETFDGDPASPSQELLPDDLEFVTTHRSHPQDHFTRAFGPYPADHGADCAGPNPEVSPLPQHEVVAHQYGTGSNPDESFFICKNHMMSSMGDVSPYTVTAFWPRQEFDFSDGGTLEFEVNINDAHAVRSWWEVMIVPRDQLKVGAGPTSSPISETYPDDRIVLDFRRNVRTIKVGEDALAPEGWLANETQWGQWDFAWWRDLHPDDPALDDRRIRRTMRMTFEQDRITWGIETADGGFDEWSVDVPGGLPFDRGLVLFKTHAYTPTKDGNLDVYTFHWDNLRFDGPVVGEYDVAEASDVVYLQRNGDRQVGESETVTIDLDEIGPNPVLFGQVHQPKTGQVLLSINGGPPTAVHPYEYDRRDCVSDHWSSFRLELDPDQLRVGENDLTWTIGPRPDCTDGDVVWDGFSVKFLQIQTDRR
ncbi:MAG: hypothetical protein AAFZ07_03150 [Actinomycetota bacterium]